MRFTPLAALAATCAIATAQDFIHYKFDANCTNEVINYATGPQALASNGLLETNAAVQWDTGVFGGCLAGGTIAPSPNTYNRVVTGWNPATQNITGSLTMAWFMRQRSSPGTTLYYMAGAPTGGFRLFTNGVAGQGLYQRVLLASGGNGVNASIANDFYLPAATTNVQALAAAGWVHIAIVVDAAASTADWYVNGTSVLQLTNVVGGALINAAGPFMLGAYTTSLTGAGSPYDIDEFVMSLRAYAPQEILALSLAQKAGDGDYVSGTTSQCGAGNVTLASSGGAPFAGNAAYSLDVSATTPSVYVLLAGFDRCVYGGVIPLPLDGTPLTPLLNGCWILADAPVTLGGFTAGPPTANPVPIPAATPPGFALFTQVLALDAATFATSMSKGFATHVGY